MPRPLPIFIQSDYLIKFVDIWHTEWQTVQVQIRWLHQKPTDLDVHRLQRQGISGFCRTRVKLVLFDWNLTLYSDSTQITNICSVFAGSTTSSVKRHSITQIRGWSGGSKVLCILHHWGVQLILAYSWARPAILVVGKGRGGMFLFLLFLHFHSCSSFFPVPLFHLLYSLFYLFSPFLWETTQNDPQGLTCR